MVLTGGRTRHFGALPELVTRTDPLAIVPLTYARALVPRYALRVSDLPELGPRYDVRMVWHESADQDLRHRWLREVVRRLFGQAEPAYPRPAPKAPGGARPRRPGSRPS